MLNATNAESSAMGIIGAMHNAFSLGRISSVFKEHHYRGFTCGARN
jgi:hypothetical protein